MKNNPKVIIPNHIDGEGNYILENKEWYPSTLRDAIKDLEIFNLQLAAIDLSVRPWKPDDISLYLYHAKRVEKCDLKYPIILDPTGYIIDGWHRVVKSILESKTTIKAVRLRIMPEPDNINK